MAVISHILPLEEVTFFQDMPQVLVARIEGYMYVREYEPRQIIHFPDDTCDYLYWVRGGRVRITRNSQEEKEFTFRHVRTGDCFGEEALGHRSRRENYAEALENTTLWLLRGDDAGRLMRDDNIFAGAMARHLVTRLNETEEVLVSTVFEPVRQRVIMGLARLLPRPMTSGLVQLSLTHQELANLIGSTRETTTFALHTLRDEGLLTIKNRQIIINEPDVLLERSGLRI